MTDDADLGHALRDLKCLDLDCGDLVCGDGLMWKKGVFQCLVENEHACDGLMQVKVNNFMRFVKGFDFKAFTVFYRRVELSLAEQICVSLRHAVDGWMVDDDMVELIEVDEDDVVYRMLCGVVGVRRLNGPVTVRENKYYILVCGFCVVVDF